MKKLFVLELSDKRLNYVKNELINKGYLAIGFSEIEKYINENYQFIYVFPPKFAIENHLDKIKNEAIIYLFTLSKNVQTALEARNIKFILLLNDDNYKLENNRLSAEGALGKIIVETDYSLSDMKILVIGYGGLGKEIIRVFLPHTKDLTISTTKNELDVYKETNIKTQNHKTTEAELNCFDLIINTVPFKIFNNIKLKKYSSYFELASNEFPITENDCIKYNAKYFLLSALPSKTAFKSAGEVLMKTILKNN